MQQIAGNGTQDVSRNGNNSAAGSEAAGWSLPPLAECCGVARLKCELEHCFEAAFPGCAGSWEPGVVIEHKTVQTIEVQVEPGR